MDFIKAMNKVFDGYKVRAKYFSDNCYIYFDKNNYHEKCSNSGLMMYNQGCIINLVLTEKLLNAKFEIIETKFWRKSWIK